MKPFVSEQIQTYLDDGLQEGLVIACMKEAVSRNKCCWSYVKRILDNCINDNIKTKEQFYIKQKEFKSKNSKSPPKYKTKEKIEYEEVIFDNEQDYQNKLLGKET